jgi:hypothetical protein
MALRGRSKDRVLTTWPIALMSDSQHKAQQRRHVQWVKEAVVAKVVVAAARVLADAERAPAAAAGVGSKHDG